MDSVKKNGGTVLTEKTTVPGVGYFAYCKDTEGNTFGIMEEDESAK
jgi:predicted enzyme related to lactoylglutathione lyase